MKIRTIVNMLIVGSILLIVYLVAGRSYVNFHTGGQAEFLRIAEQINGQCNANGACPTSLKGWRETSAGPLRKDDMLYIVSPGEGGKAGATAKAHQAFRLIYTFFAPDSWFQAQGGVGIAMTSGMVSRESQQGQPSQKH
jgi:hypothetical protein